jgi:hypothetical protein
MKLKILSICLLFVSIFLSCRKEDSSIVNNKKGLLLSQVVIDDQPSNEFLYNSAYLISIEKSKYDFTMNYYNDKNQLVSSDYFANNDLINSDLQIFQAALNKIGWVTAESSNKAGSMIYEYNANDQLVKSTYSATSGSKEHSEFSYDANNRINRQILFWEDKETGYIEYSYVATGNLVKEILYNQPQNGTAEISTTTLYEFDNKINPFKLVSKLQFPGITTNQNNIVKETYTINTPITQAADLVQVTGSTYTYNDQGYPVSKNGNVRYIYN